VRERRPPPAPPSPEHSLAAKVAAAGTHALKARGPLLVGVSGGGDSLALLHLLGEVAPERPRIAAIVDHGLRPESADEARQAAAIARDLGAEAIILQLDWPHGEKRAQEAARIARHTALADLARIRGAPVLYLGHTLDDQAETVLMRRLAGSKDLGLAGMAPLSPSPIWPEGRDLWVARPLIFQTRETLRDHLRAEGIRWIEDPSNDALRYARVRARRELKESAETSDLVDLARVSALMAARAHGHARLAAGLFLRHEGGVVRFPASLLDHAGGPLALAALAVAAGARTRDIPQEAAAGLLRRLRQEGHTALGGAHFVRTEDGVTVSRDPGGVHGRRGGGQPHPALDLAPGHPVVWDRRLEITAIEPCWSARPSADGAATAPAFTRNGVETDPGAAVATRWLLEARMARLLWRGAEPPFR